MTQKYRMTCRCACGSEFKKITTNRKYFDLDDGSQELTELMAKIKCPACKKADSERRFRMGDGAVSDNDLVVQPNIISTDMYNCNACSKKNRFYKEKEGDCLAHCQYCGSQDVKYIGHTMAGITSQSSQNMIKALDMTAKMTMETYGMNDLNLNSNMRPGDSCAPKLPPAQQKAADAFFNGGGIHNASALGAKAIAGAYRDNNNPVANLHRSKATPKFDIIQAPPVNVKAGAKISAYDKMLNRPN
jgi:hypothetical protein